MRLIRPFSAVVAALALAAGLTGPAVAQQPSGLGTSRSSTDMLAAQLGAGGSVLDLKLLVDEAQSTLDSAVAAPSAFSRLSLGKVASAVAAADAVNKVLPSFEAKSSGPTSTDVAGGSLGLAAPVLSGTVQAGKLTALLDNGVASSSLDAGLAGVQDLVGGLLGVASAKTALSSQAATDNSNASRTVAIDDITVLDLGALLQGLGIDLGSLSLDQVAGLLDSLGALAALEQAAGIDIPDAETSLAGLLDTLNATIDELQATVDAATATLLEGLDQAVVDTVGTLLGSLPLPLPTENLTDSAEIQTAIDTLNGVINDLQTQLTALVEALANEGVSLLDSLSLLRLEGVEMGVVTKAVQDLAQSTAAVTGKIGKVIVGNTTVSEGLDLAGATETLTAAVTKVNGALGDVLGTVHPDLADLVEVSLLDKATEVVTKDGYSTATAGVTALTAAITPPAALADIVATVNALVADVLEVVDVLGIDLAAVADQLGLGQLMNALESTLGLTTSALSQPASVKIAQVLSASNFRAAATTTAAPGSPVAPGSSPTLPRTGADTMLLTAAAAIVIGLIGRRLLLTPEPKRVRVDK